MFSRYLTVKTVIRVISIDPSTTNMGVCIIDIDLTGASKPKIIYVNTIFGEQVKFNIPTQHNDLNGTSVAARSYALSRSLKELLNIYEPDVAICEDNFLGMSADTFKQLIKAVAFLREACEEANSPLHLSYVAPKVAKAVVNADFKGTTKDDVKKGVKAYKNLDVGDVDLDELDEHSIDAVAIGLYQVEMILMDYEIRLAA